MSDLVPEKLKRRLGNGSSNDTTTSPGKALSSVASCGSHHVSSISQSSPSSQRRASGEARPPTRPHIGSEKWWSSRSLSPETVPREYRSQREGWANELSGRFETEAQSCGFALQR